VSRLGCSCISVDIKQNKKNFPGKKWKGEMFDAMNSMLGMSPTKPLVEKSFTKAFVTGGSGFVGQRLVEMLHDKGVIVVSFDISPKPKDALESENIEYIKGDLTNLESLNEIIKTSGDIDIVFHIAALVGPYHAKEAYYAVNYQGTLNLLEACKVNTYLYIYIYMCT
jgi:GDP-D-mannose dehydratase